MLSYVEYIVGTCISVYVIQRCRHLLLTWLQVKTSMLAVGACERVKKIGRSHPRDILNSPILPELISIIADGPGTPLAGAAMSALATLALCPEGRQQIVLKGGATPIVK